MRAKFKLNRKSLASKEDVGDEWRGPRGYDETKKRTNRHKAIPHRNIVCHFDANCEFNKLSWESRTIYSFGRHFETKHVEDCANLSESLNDIFV